MVGKFTSKSGSSASIHGPMSLMNTEAFERAMMGRNPITAGASEGWEKSNN